MSANTTSAAGREQLLNRPSNRWYQSGYLAPTETNLGERAVDANDEEFVAQVASAGGAFVKRRGTGPFALRLEQVQPVMRPRRTVMWMSGSNWIPSHPSPLCT